jgi:hypothetical protein
MCTINNSPQSRTDRRENPRQEIDILMNRFLDGYPYLCRATDISRTGMRIQPISQGGNHVRFVGLEFQLPGSDDVLTASGEIVSTRSDQGSIGIRFTQIPRVASKRIQHFLTSI